MSKFEQVSSDGHQISVAEEGGWVQWRTQDLPEVGAPTLGGGGCQHTILPNFPQNCMKSKEFGSGGGAHASNILLCRSATVGGYPRSHVGAMSGGGGVPLVTYPIMHLMLPTPREHTHACENITFVRLLRVVKVP